MGIGYAPCKCTEEESDPHCRNSFSYVRDWVGGQPVVIRECPRKLEDSELWSDIRVALWEVKDWDKVLGFYGVPVIHLSVPVYNMLQLSFNARDRYHSQKAEKEG